MLSMTGGNKRIYVLKNKQIRGSGGWEGAQCFPVLFNNTVIVNKDI